MKTASAAPGKIVLLGEYSVLFGAPALVMAVDRRARVDIYDHEREGIEILAPDVCAQARHFTIDQGRTLQCLEGETAAQPLVLVTAVLHAMLAAGILDPQNLALRIEIDTSSFFHTDEQGRRNKLGLGSSAALTVALASGLAAHVDRTEYFEDADFWLQQLLTFHREFQHGRGSGIDIAASLYGGVSRYQLDTTRSGHAEPCRWPQDVLRMPIWSGESASTPRFLEALDQWSERDPQQFSSIFADLGNLADIGTNAAAAQDSALLLETVGKFTDTLQSLGDAAKIPIMTAEHARIRSLAKSLGCEYKPCGAGGGDLGLALSRDADALAALREALVGTASSAVDLKDDEEGLRIMTVES